MTPDDVRAIVREEIREAFKVLVSKADAFPDYGTDTIEDTAARMLSKVAENVEEALRHTPKCKVRNGHRYYFDCDCGEAER